MTELKRCWRCGRPGIFVNKSGIPSYEETGLVSCFWRTCMSDEEIYTVDQWNKRAVEDELEKKIAKLQAENDELKKAQGCSPGVFASGDFSGHPSYIRVYQCENPVTVEPQWLPVSVPPTEGEKYWAMDDCGQVLKAVYKRGLFYPPKEDWKYIDITHYMPRQGKPKPPK